MNYSLLLCALFLLQTSYLWIEKKFQRKMAKQVALKNWYNIRNAACIYTVARRATTDEFVFNCINAGARLATKAILDSGVMLRPKKGKDKHGHKRDGEKRKHSHKHGANDHLQFFLTEFDGPDGNGESVGTVSDGEMGFGSSSEDGKTNRLHLILLFLVDVCAVPKVLAEMVFGPVVVSSCPVQCASS